MNTRRSSLMLVLLLCITSVTQPSRALAEEDAWNNCLRTVNTAYYSTINPKIQEHNVRCQAAATVYAIAMIGITAKLFAAELAAFAKWDAESAL